MNKDFTGILDKNGNKIHVDDIVELKNMEGKVTYYKVRFSEYHNQYVGDNIDEIYDVSAKKLEQSVIVKMNNEFTCCCCKKTLIAEFDSGAPGELETGLCCNDCFMKSLEDVCDDVLPNEEKL